MISSLMDSNHNSLLGTNSGKNSPVVDGNGLPKELNIHRPSFGFADSLLNEENSSSPEPESNSSSNLANGIASNLLSELTANNIENVLEAQQKAFQKFTSQFSGFNFRSPFQLNNLPPFLAALQQNPLSFHQQMLNSLAGTGSGSAPSSSRVSPEQPDDDEDDGINNPGNVEPEDLSIGKEKKSDGDGDSNCSTAAPSWSYEEQFKQLYELSDDVKRKEWLDDWLGYMHRIGKPVTRIPIMAKQVLDLYELYRLVVQHGGLVEIINKKLWREITKGLNLPASITSAAFTLRTQYQKYLYDFECERENLSTPSELQQAIEGNKREGRRTGHGSGNGSSLNGGLGGSSSGLILSATGSGCGSAGTSANPFTFPFSTPHSAAAAAAAANSFLGKHLNGAFGLHDDQSNNGLPGLPTTPQAFAAAAFKAEQLAGLEAQQRHWEMLQRVAVEAATRQQNLSLPNMNSKSGRDSTSSYDDSEAGVPAKRSKIEQSNGPQTTNDSIAQQNLLSLEKIFKNSPSTHIKLNNSCTPGGDNSMVVSMEVNGVMYQGVLFAVNQISITNGNGSVENSDVTDLSTKINGNM